jgi:hypothetical protein
MVAFSGVRHAGLLPTDGKKASVIDLKENELELEETACL